MTFSIVGADLATGDLGIAVQSKFFAVGALVPFAAAGVGAVATQAHVDPTIGPRALALLGEGVAPQECIEPLLADDPLAQHRQFGIVDAQGRSAAFTGNECYDHASHHTAAGVAVQGNILAGRAVVDDMVAAFEDDPGASLAERLLRALTAGQAAGGDRRGQQSAAVLVMRRDGGYGGNHDLLVDLRVDDHERPIEELHRLYGIYRLMFERPDPATLLSIDDDLRSELRRLLNVGEETDVSPALWRYMATENFEERWVEDDRIDPVVLDHLRAQKRGS